MDGKNYYSGNTNAKYTYFLTMDNFTTITNITGGKLKLAWNSNTSATGYEIYIETEDMIATYFIKDAAIITKTIAGLDIGLTAKFQIRAYKTVGSVKYYSPWTAVKTVAIKK